MLCTSLCHVRMDSQFLCSHSGKTGEARPAQFRDQCGTECGAEFYFHSAVGGERRCLYDAPIRGAHDGAEYVECKGSSARAPARVPTAAGDSDKPSLLRGHCGGVLVLRPAHSVAVDSGRGVCSGLRCGIRV